MTFCHKLFSHNLLALIAGEEQGGKWVRAVAGILSKK